MKFNKTVQDGLKKHNILLDTIFTLGSGLNKNSPK